MDSAILAAYDRPVPRYTSYPTAAQFTTAVGTAQHWDWLRDVNGQSAVLYLHVPFCRDLCWYCACHTMAMRRTGTLEAYGDALSEELLRIKHAAPVLGIDGIQWGGGTPGQLGPARLRRLGRRIAMLFDRRSDAEISFELDPRHCTGDLAAAIAEIGVNRVSLGVQDFDPAVQKAINRIQSFEVTATSIGLLRSEGVKRFSIDLVYGLPAQTLESLDRTLDQALRLGATRFAVFGYAHVPWMKPHQKLINEAWLPGAAARSAMADLVARRLVEAGYVKIGLDHYARPDDTLAVAAQTGRLHRNFQGYVTDRSPWVVGVGASAISSLPKGFVQNIADPAFYMSRIESGELATARGLPLTDDDRLRAAIIQNLICQNRVDIGSQCARFNVDPDAFIASIEDLPALERDGLIVRDKRQIDVTGDGLPLVRFVCAAFDRHYTGEAGKHSRGI